MSSIIKCCEEAEMRNAFMSRHYGTNIPSYGLWTELAISKEREVDRVNWWLDFKKECNDELENSVDNFLNSFYK